MILNEIAYMWKELTDEEKQRWSDIANEMNN